MTLNWCDSSIVRYATVFRFCSHNLPPTFLDRLAKVVSYISSFINQDVCDQDPTSFIGDNGRYFFQGCFYFKFWIFEQDMACAIEKDVNFRKIKS